MNDEVYDRLNPFAAFQIKENDGPLPPILSVPASIENNSTDSSIASSLQ
jgi:hypothetical protein